MMLDREGFNQWSGQYDQDILRMQDQGYPFDGYYAVLGFIQKRITDKAEQEARTLNVLDLGIGTGALSEVLYHKGIGITGIDLSEQMLDKAQAKMPLAKLHRYDLALGLPSAIKESTYDAIISTYALHHFTDEQNVRLINQLLESHCQEGEIFIGDVAFQSVKDREGVRNTSTHWDDDEHYFTYDVLSDQLDRADIHHTYTQISSCAGVLCLRRQY